jgi:hypothetical protein
VTGIMRRRRRTPFVAVSVVLLTTALLVGPAAGSSSAPTPAAPAHAGADASPPAATGVIASPLANPHAVVAADGRRHLVYELQLINVTYSSVTVSKIQTLVPAIGRVLATMDADAVARLMTPFGGGDPGPTLQPGGAGYILMDASLSRSAHVPHRLIHELTVTYHPDQGFAATERSGLTRVVRDQPVVIDGPLTGRRWIAFNGCCTGPNGHRNAVNPLNGALHVSERFAIDFAQLGADGRGFHGDPTELTAYPSYGAHVVSVARGVVVATRDGIADNVPVGSLPPISLDTVAGNYVVVDIGRGHFTLSAHLQPGSLKVGVGDRVRQGQLLGLLGNSGNSDFPHLHFQVMDRRSPLVSDGLPYEYRFFTSEGLVANPDELFAGEPAVFDPSLSGSHFHRLPLELQSVDFRPATLR